jgi:hypothetical protein
MRAATDLAAREIRTAPPLRLPPEPAAGARRRHAPRRWIWWVGPLTAAAAVVTLAISLVLVRDIQNGGAVPPNPAASTGPGGIPRYYVALQKFPGKNGTAENNIVVGDSLTGRAVAKFAPPAHVTFWSVSASADDRTFVVQALTPAKPGEVLLWPNLGTGKITASWYEVHLAPGTAHPARLTLLPIKPQSWISPSSFKQSTYDPATTGVVSTAVSQSGRELAVLGVTAAGREEVKVFSLATGQLLHDWTTDNPSVRVPVQWVINEWPLQALTWVDGDRALAFAAVTSVQVAPSTGVPSAEGTLRSLNVAGPRIGDLLADSTPIWSGRLLGTDWFTSCFASGTWPVPISADGKTVSCGQTNGSRIVFVTNPLTARAAATSAIDYQLKSASGTDVGVLWTSPSSGTLIGVWGTYTSATQPIHLNFGVISHGRFTPLRLPSSLTSTLQPGLPFPIAF